MPLRKFLSRADENNSHALLGKQGVCIYKRSKPTISGDAGDRRFCLLGSIPNPLNSVSRWLRLCEPDRFFEKMPLPFAGQFAIMLVSQLRRLQKISAGGGRKSAGTVRSRRMKFCEKGVGGGSHQQAKTDFRRSRRKSVLSICGNKYTACKVAKMRVFTLYYFCS